MKVAFFIVSILLASRAYAKGAQEPATERPIETAGISRIMLYSVRRLPLQLHESPRPLYHSFPVLGSTETANHSTIMGILGVLNNEIIPSVKDHCMFDARYGLSISYEAKTVDYVMSSRCLHGFEYDQDKIKRTFSLRTPSSTAKLLENFLLNAGIPLEPLPVKDGASSAGNRRTSGSAGARP